MTDQELINYYVNLLIIQYKTLPNATGTIAALAEQTVANQIFNQVLNGFDLQTAIGAQLDILAGYVGAPRTIFGYSPAIEYFTLWPYSATPTGDTGFALYADTTDPIDFWLLYSSSLTTFTLSDGQLRELIEYLIAVHMSDHTLYSIDLILQQFFGLNCIMTDNENMTMTYTHQLSDPSLLFSIVNQLGKLPHPAGVEIIVVEV